MAAPTNVRVEANSITTTVIRFTYGGSGFVGVYRSTDGVIFAVVNTTTATSPFTDTGLEPGTKYWYKLSDDEGSTFSSTVTVVTHSCLSSSSELPNFAREQFEGAEQQSEELNKMFERIEAALQGQLLDPSQCVACPEDGAVVIDCSGGCHDWLVIADQDINSIAIQWCDDREGTINFVVPPNTTGRKICGFPAGFGFTGDECTDFPITTGATPRKIGVGFGTGGGGGGANTASSKSSPGASEGTAMGGGGGGADCTCIPGSQGELTIKCCTADCSINCSGMVKEIKLLVCGGIGPYNWTSNAPGVELFKWKHGTSTSVIGSQMQSGGRQVTVTAPPNTGSAVAGTAYTKILGFWNSICNVCNTFSFGGNNGAGYDCADVLETPNCDTSAATATPNCLSPAPVCADLGTCENATCVTGDACTQIKARGQIRDVRTAGMITDGCNPCGVAAAGKVITVTDFTGTSTSITLGS